MLSVSRQVRVGLMHRDDSIQSQLYGENLLFGLGSLAKVRHFIFYPICRRENSK